MLSLFSSRSQNQTFSLVCRQPLPYRSAASPRQQVPDDCLWRRQRSSDSGDVTCGAAAPFPSPEVCAPRSVEDSIRWDCWCWKCWCWDLALWWWFMFCHAAADCATTRPSIHYPSIPPPSKVFAPQGIIPPDSVTVEPPQLKYFPSDYFPSAPSLSHYRHCHWGLSVPVCSALGHILPVAVMLLF